MTTQTSTTMKKPPVRIERTLRAPVARVWTLWTTKEGLEKWWGPEGFTSTVRRVDVRVGGGFEIVMTAVLQAIIDYLASTGAPASSVDKGDYSEVETNRRLAWVNGVDFIPGVAPYDSATAVDFEALPEGGTRIVIVTDAMHDDHWTKMKTMGWEGQLEKLAGLVADVA